MVTFPRDALRGIAVLVTFERDLRYGDLMVSRTYDSILHRCLQGWYRKSSIGSQPYYSEYGTYFPLTANGCKKEYEKLGYKVLRERSGTVHYSARNKKELKFDDWFIPFLEHHSIQSILSGFSMGMVVPCIDYA